MEGDGEWEEMSHFQVSRLHSVLRPQLFSIYIKHLDERAVCIKYTFCNLDKVRCEEEIKS